jgi:hypothetical protein
MVSDPGRALADTDLTEGEKHMLSSMRRVALEEWGVDVRKYRAFLRDNGYKPSPI